LKFFPLHRGGSGFVQSGFYEVALAPALGATLCQATSQNPQDSQKRFFAWQRRIAPILIFSTTLSVVVTKHVDLSAIKREAQAWLTLLITQQRTISVW